jgi:YHS domain-containing protein
MIETRLRALRVATAVAIGLVLTRPEDTPAQSPDAGPIPWRGDLGTARAEAASLGRLVWVQFAGPWCHNCHRMDRETFTNPAVLGDAVSHFIPVRLRSDHHEDLALSYGLSALPATVILRPTGEVVSTAQGYRDPGSFTGFLRHAMEREGRALARTATRTEVTGPKRPESSPATLALAGCCPVSLVDQHRLVAGQPAVMLEHDGRVYRFAHAEARKLFRAQPERYVPVNVGRCPVAQVDRGESRAGSPKWGVLYEGHLYLCGDEAGRRRFLQRPERYAHVDVADRGFCPHCWASERLLVRGRADYSLTRGGRRFLFPDPGHLEAFRSSPSQETARR